MIFLIGNCIDCDKAIVMGGFSFCDNEECPFKEEEVKDEEL